MSKAIIWKDIEGYEGLYQVNQKGEVRSLDRIVGLHVKSFRKGVTRKPRENRDGYMDLLLYKNGIPKRHLVHRLVANAFVLNPEEKEFVNHIDRDKTNNKVSNLEWATRQENAQHAVENGLITKGPKDAPVRVWGNGILKHFPNMTMASEFIGCTRKEVRVALKYNIKCKGYQISAI